MARSKKSSLLSLDQQKYRQLAKQANQRAVRLERFIADHPDAPKSALQLYNYYLNYAYGSPDQGRKIKRFPENPNKLSEQQLKEYTVLLSNFLNTDLSKVSNVKKYEKQYQDYVKAKQGGSAAAIPDNVKGIFEQAVNTARKTGAEQKVLKGKKILSPDDYFKQLGRMYQKKLMKVLDYRDAMKILLNVQNVSKESVKRLIDKTAEELERNEKLTYRQIRKKFENLKYREKRKKKKTT